MSVVTISRELGSDGTQIAEAVAGRLGAHCVDKEVLAEMARLAGVSVQAVVDAEERLLSRPTVVSDEMRAFFKRSQAPGGFSEEQYIEQMAAAIRAMADQGDIVFVGRGAQIVLAGRADALHVHLYAPEDVRAARIGKRRNLADANTALRLIQQSDEQRRDWYRRFFSRANWKDSRYYHLMINTGRIAAEQAVEIIVRAAQ